MRLSGKLEIRFDLLGENVDCLKKIAHGNEILFMVKANAYGHGLTEIVNYSFNELGIKEFGVATLGEALVLREQLPDVFCDIYVFSDLELMKNDYYRYYLDKRLIPVIASKLELEFVLNKKELSKLPLCLKFNTGMNRLGFELSEVSELATLLRNQKRSIHHLMTHMACAAQSMKTNKRNQKQCANFSMLKETFQSMGVSIDKTSIANSGMIEQEKGLEETHIRPGLLLFGPSAMTPQVRQTSKYHGKNISSLKTEVLHVFDADRGQPIGYGGTPIPRAGKIAIVALGYGDGITQAYKGLAVSHRGSTGVVCGRINMDMTYLLFGSDAEIEVGDQFTFWDHDTKVIHGISDHTRTSAYELFCQITTRVPRTYQIN